MTDTELAIALTQVTKLERVARAHWTASNDVAPERGAAIGVVRKATDLKRTLEQWIAARACRAALQES